MRIEVPKGFDRLDSSCNRFRTTSIGEAAGILDIMAAERGGRYQSET
jgi:hypothetical protein